MGWFIGFAVWLVIVAGFIYARRRANEAVEASDVPYELRTVQEFLVPIEFGALEVPASTSMNARRFALREERRMKEMR